jgi:hypothetical protein
MPRPVKSKTTVHKSRSSSTPDNTTRVVTNFIKANPHILTGDKPVRLKIIDKKPDETQVIYDVSVKACSSRQNSDDGQQSLIITHMNEPKVVLACKGPVKPPSDDCKGLCLPKGPWECEMCTENGLSLKFETYYDCRMHFVSKHKVKFDPRECDFCGLQMFRKTELPFHKFIKHRIVPEGGVKFPGCDSCSHVAFNEKSLQEHMNFYHKPQMVSSSPYTSKDKKSSRLIILPQRDQQNHKKNIRSSPRNSKKIEHQEDSTAADLKPSHNKKSKYNKTY